MNFFYVYFSDGTSNQIRMLILSIMTVRNFYPESKIIVIDYSNDSKLNDLSKEYQFQVISKTPCYNDKKNILINMVSKPMDCILIAESLNLENIVLLDSDIFLLNKFSPINFDKFSIFYRKKTGYNSGILFFSTKSDSTKILKEVYNFVVDRCNEQITFVHYCQEKFNYTKRNSINEETLIGATLESLPFLKEKYFCNIEIENHGHLDYFINEPNNKFNNIHFLSFVLKNLGAQHLEKYQYPLTLKEFKFLEGKIDENLFQFKPSFNLSFKDLRKKLTEKQNEYRRFI